jgi:hypothetical protein
VALVNEWFGRQKYAAARKRQDAPAPIGTYHLEVEGWTPPGPPEMEVKAEAAEVRAYMRMPGRASALNAVLFQGPAHRHRAEASATLLGGPTEATSEENQAGRAAHFAAFPCESRRTALGSIWLPAIYTASCSRTSSSASILQLVHEWRRASTYT